MKSQYLPQSYMYPFMTQHNSMAHHWQIPAINEVEMKMEPTIHYESYGATTCNPMISDPLNGNIMNTHFWAIKIEPEHGENYIRWTPVKIEPERSPAVQDMNCSPCSSQNATYLQPSNTLARHAIDTSLALDLSYRPGKCEQQPINRKSGEVKTEWPYTITCNVGTTIVKSELTLNETCDSRSSGNDVSDNGANQNAVEEEFCHVDPGIKRTDRKHKKKRTQKLSCEVCRKTFARAEQLGRHIKTHTGERPYSCSICNKAFSQAGNLKTHMWIHTGEKPYGCDLCNKRFNSNALLNTHKNSHTGEKPYSCDICHKSFSASYNRNQHMLTHTEEKPYSCNICQKTFAISSYLKQHMLTHTEDKAYSCNICSKAFYNSGNLKRHMRKHTGEKPHACHICDRKFSMSCNLKQHMLTHTGEKPYECKVCNKSFAALGNMKNHMSTHKEKPRPLH